MIRKFIVSTVASLALLGSTMAAAECPAYLNAEEGVPCISEKMTETTADTVAAKIHLAIPPEQEKPITNTDSWTLMAQGE